MQGYPNRIPSQASIPSSPRNYAPTSQVSLTANDVSRLTSANFREGESVKGQSRISYMPYERKVTEYEERQYVERVPIKRKVIQYEERVVVEEIPREVVMTDYYAVENIKQYYKEVIPEKKIEMVPVEKKVKRVEYVPVEKQIVHYPENQNEDFAKGQSRMILQNQGVTVRPDAEYRRIDPKLIYNYSAVHREKPIGYVEDGYERNLSTAPTIYSHDYLPSQTYVSQVQPYTYSSQYGDNQYYSQPQQTYINTAVSSPRNNYLYPSSSNFNNNDSQKYSQTSTTYDRPYFSPIN